MISAKLRHTVNAAVLRDPGLARSVLWLLDTHAIKSLLSMNNWADMEKHLEYLAPVLDRSMVAWLCQDPDRSERILINPDYADIVLSLPTNRIAELMRRHPNISSGVRYAWVSSIADSINCSRTHAATLWSVKAIVAYRECIAGGKCCLCVADEVGFICNTTRLSKILRIVRDNRCYCPRCPQVVYPLLVSAPVKRMSDNEMDVLLDIIDDVCAKPPAIEYWRLFLHRSRRALLRRWYACLDSPSADFLLFHGAAFGTLPTKLVRKILRRHNIKDSAVDDYVNEVLLSVCEEANGPKKKTSACYKKAARI